MYCERIYDVHHSPFGFRPSRATGVTFATIFGILMILHIVQSIQGRLWWLVVFAVGCLGELMGWAARAGSFSCWNSLDLYLVQAVTLIMGPIFFSAGMYLVLGYIIKDLGPGSSFLTSRRYLAIFYLCDLVSLLLQGAGAGVVSNALGTTAAGGDLQNANLLQGTHIMISGIIFQLLAMTAFAFCVVELLFRAKRQGTLLMVGRRFGTILAAVFIATLCIYVRGVYRVVEMFDGWKGYIITHERYCVGFDASMMVLAPGIFNMFHPSASLSRPMEDVRSNTVESLGKLQGTV